MRIYEFTLILTGDPNEEEADQQFTLILTTEPNDF